MREEAVAGGGSEDRVLLFSAGHVFASLCMHSSCVPSVREEEERETAEVEGGSEHRVLLSPAGRCFGKVAHALRSHTQCERVRRERRRCLGMVRKIVCCYPWRVTFLQVSVCAQFVDTQCQRDRRERERGGDSWGRSCGAVLGGSRFRQFVRALSV